MPIQGTYDSAAAVALGAARPSLSETSALERAPLIKGAFPTYGSAASAATATLKTRQVEAYPVKNVPYEKFYQKKSFWIAVVCAIFATAAFAAIAIVPPISAAIVTCLLLIGIGFTIAALTATKQTHEDLQLQKKTHTSSIGFNNLLSTKSSEEFFNTLVELQTLDSSTKKPGLIKRFAKKVSEKDSLKQLKEKTIAFCKEEIFVSETLELLERKLKKFSFLKKTTTFYQPLIKDIQSLKNTLKRDPSIVGADELELLLLKFKYEEDPKNKEPLKKYIKREYAADDIQFIGSLLKISIK
jgi:hypothetical protein